MKLTDLKPGDWVKIDDEGVEREGTVIKVSPEEHEVCIDNGIQEFWYSLDHVKGVPVNEAQLLRLGFTRLESATGAEYGKGPFRILVSSPDDFSTIKIWYREDIREFDHPVMVHELQNYHLAMTKMPLEA